MYFQCKHHLEPAGGSNVFLNVIREQQLKTKKTTKETEGDVKPRPVSSSVELQKRKKKRLHNCKKSQLYRSRRCLRRREPLTPVSSAAHKPWYSDFGPAYPPFQTVTSLFATFSSLPRKRFESEQPFWQPKSKRLFYPP